MRIGLISPYSFDRPGGVQFHIRDLAEELIKRGHYVNVLAPANEDTDLPEYVTSAGKAVPVRYNGSVARLSFGPRAAAKTKKWLDENNFDLIHPHEPISPSLAMLSVWQTNTPVVATFHSNQNRSRALQIAAPILKTTLNRISAKIAVSEDARRTVIDHLDWDATIIPNGIAIANFTQTTGQNQYSDNLITDSPVIAFLGRLDESRKGLSVLVQAIPKVLAKHPKAQFLIAGEGESGKASAITTLGPLVNNVTFLGKVTEAEKTQLLQNADIFVAPQTGGESFGIVLIEAMAAGTPVIASDLSAFRQVLADGAAGQLFPVGNAEALAHAINQQIENPALRESYRQYASEWVKQFDWEIVASKILAVYESVLAQPQ